jgi:site-specific DNA recombinase
VPKAAAIYCRISHDPSGERLGVNRQEDDCRTEAARRHWQVAGIYVDDDRSAFSTRKPRPEYQRLLRDIQAGDVDGVLIWRLDRLHRQPKELEEFIVITDKFQVSLATVTGDVDLSTTQGRLLARAWGAFAAHESEVKSERLKRAFLERARKGRDAWTIRMYGYNPDLRTVNKREAAVIKEAAKRMLRGESLHSMAVDFNRRKIRTTNGKVWSPSHLRALLRNPRLAGLAKYHGEIVGKGAWPAILRPIDSSRLRELFHDRGRQNNSANSPNILAGLLVCGWCGTKMAPSNGSPEVDRRRYACPKILGRTGCGRVSVMSSYVEAAALEMIVARVASPDVSKRPVRTAARDRRWTEAAQELDRAQRLLETMARDLGEGRLSRREWLLVQPPLAERIQKYTGIVMQDRYDAGIREYIGHPETLREAWPKMASSQRRTVLRGLIDHVVVRRATVGQRTFDPLRLTFRWRGDGPFSRPRRMQAPPHPRCGVRGCDQLAKCRRLCPMHYRRMQTVGATGAAGPTENHWFIGRPCKTPGCTVDSTHMGWCRIHYEAWLKETAGLPRCHFTDCERPVKVKGVCLRHYNHKKYQAARAIQIAEEGVQPNLRTMKPCKERVCGVRTVGKGLCAEHYEAWLHATADLERCAWDACERPREVRGMCSKHELRVRYYSKRPPGSAALKSNARL